MTAGIYLCSIRTAKTTGAAEPFGDCGTFTFTKGLAASLSSISVTGSLVLYLVRKSRKSACSVSVSGFPVACELKNPGAESSSGEKIIVYVSVPGFLSNSNQCSNPLGKLKSLPLRSWFDCKPEIGNGFPVKNAVG